VCGQRRGGAVFIFGLRTHERARGRGLGRKLVERLISPDSRAALAPPGGGPPPAQLVGVTTAEQPHSVAIFRRLAFDLSRTVRVWPPYACLKAYETAIGFPAVGLPSSPPPASPTLLDFVPGAAEALQRGAGELAAERAWRRCGDAAELEASLRAVRARQAAAGDAGALGTSPSLLSVPFVYELFPLGCDWLGEQLAAGGVWLLADASGVACVLVVARSPEFRRICAGAVCANDAGLHAAVAHAARLSPHFVLFVDLPATAVDGAAPAARPQLFDCSAAEVSSFLVFTREAAAEA